MYLGINHLLCYYNAIILDSYQKNHSLSHDPKRKLRTGKLVFQFNHNLCNFYNELVGSLRINVKIIEIK